MEDYNITNLPRLDQISVDLTPIREELVIKVIHQLCYKIWLMKRWPED